MVSLEAPPHPLQHNTAKAAREQEQDGERRSRALVPWTVRRDSGDTAQRRCPGLLVGQPGVRL